MIRLTLLLLLTLPTLAHATAPLCLPRATAAALTRLGAPTDPLVLARELPMHADGVDLFDLREWLGAHGWQALVLQPEVKVLRQLLLDGWPLVVLRREAAGVHAVMLADGRQQTVMELDDRSGQPQVRPLDTALVNTQSALLVWRLPRGPRAHLPPKQWETLLRNDRDFRAAGWLRRAMEHKQANVAQRELLLRAVAASPGYQPAREALARVERELRGTSSRP